MTNASQITASLTTPTQPSNQRFALVPRPPIAGNNAPMCDLYRIRTNVPGAQWELLKTLVLRAEMESRADGFNMAQLHAAFSVSRYMHESAQPARLAPDLDNSGGNATLAEVGDGIWKPANPPHPTTLEPRRTQFLLTLVCLETRGCGPISFSSIRRYVREQHPADCDAADVAGALNTLLRYGIAELYESEGCILYSAGPVEPPLDQFGTPDFSRLAAL